MTDVQHSHFGIATISDAGQKKVAVQTAAGVQPIETLTTTRSAPPSVRSMLSDWDAWCDEIDAALAAGDAAAWRPEAEVEILPPIDDPSAIYCAGANYHDHVVEMGAPDPEEGTASPFHFLLPPAALAGNRRSLPYPQGYEKLDWEIELAVVIGRRADAVPAEEALSYVAGYTVANDISLRDRERIFHPWFGLRWLEAKGRKAMQPLGPAITPARFIADPMDLEMRLAVGGVVKQKANTSGMIFSITEQIAHLSNLVPLQPGDLVLTGTPAGTAGAEGRYLQVGDVMEASIEGIGTLTNSIAAE